MSPALTSPRYALAERPGVITFFDTLDELVASLVRATPGPLPEPKRATLSVAPCGYAEVINVDGAGFVCGLGWDVEQLKGALLGARPKALERAA